MSRVSLTPPSAVRTRFGSAGGLLAEVPRGGDPSMSDVFDKCSAWKDYKIAKATGLYPYFRPIEASHGSTEVEIEGRRVIMVRLEQLPGPGRGSAGEGGGDRRGAEVRHHLLRLAPAQRHAGPARGARARGWRSSSTARRRWSSPPASRPTSPPCPPSSAGTTSSSPTGRTTPRWWTASASSFGDREALPPQRHGAPREAARRGRPERGQDHHHRRRVLDGGRPLQPAQDRGARRRSTTRG